MGRPSNVDVHELADRLVKEVAERLRSSPFAHLRNITRGEKSVKKRFSCGADTAKRVHALAVTILQEKGYVQFRASMGKQLTFCKPTKKEEAKEREEISTFAKFGVSSPSEVKARRKERQPDKADMEKAEKDKRPDKQPDKRPAKRRHFLYKNQFATHEVPEHMQEEEESSSSSSGEEDEDSSSSSSSSSRKPKASSARSSAARKAFRGAKAKAVQEQHRLEKADAEEKKSMGAASEASANKAPASKADAEEKKSMGAASEASANKAPASKADAEEKKSMGATPEASADKAPASKADAEEKKSMEAAPEASANKAPASKILVAESSKALEAMAMSISTGASAPSLAEPVPNVPPGLPPLSAQTGSLYRHLAGSQLHRRDEVGNIIQQLVQLGDTLEAMQA